MIVEDIVMSSGTNLTNITDLSSIGLSYSIGNVLVLILIGLFLCLISPIAMRMLSQEISKLGVFHTEVSMKHRIYTLYYTYRSILTLMWLFITLSIISFVSSSNAMDILLCALISSAVISLSTRIIVTTGLIKPSSLETAMGMTFREVRERYLSSIYSVVTFILLTTSLAIIFIVAKLICHQNIFPTDSNILVSLSTVFGLTKVILLWLGIPLVLATFGEFIRWIVTFIFKKNGIGFELVLDEIESKPAAIKSASGKTDLKKDISKANK